MKKLDKWRQIVDDHMIMCGAFPVKHSGVWSKDSDRIYLSA